MSFSLTYAMQELRRRWARTLLTALGLAAGVSLVVGVIGVSQALDDAQQKVLSPLGSVGTDLLVTRVVGANQPGAQGASANPPIPSPGVGGGRQFGGGFFGGAAPAGLNQQDAAALLNEDSSVATDLAKLGKPGDKFTRDFFLPATLLSFPDAALTDVAKQRGVNSAVGGLSLLATHQTGTVPQIVATFQTGGQTLTQQIDISPLTDAERQQVGDCLRKQQAAPAPAPQPSARSGAPPPQAQPAPAPFEAGAIQGCLPDRFRHVIARVQTALQTIQQVLAPPQTDISSVSYSVAGVDPRHPDEGLITRAQVVQGRYLKRDASDELLLSAGYASRNKLAVGSAVPINGTSYHIVGIVSPTLNGENADVYFPLNTLQKLAHEEGRVNLVMVKASDASSVGHLSSAISHALPGAQVVTAKSLADEVSGSLVDAKALADRLGGAVALIVLLGAFIIAVLLTLGAVAKRVREIGTLRAIGWPRQMVVRQILLETLVIGILGGALGAFLGVAVDAAVARYSPSLTASSVVLPGIGSSSLARLLGPAAATVAPATGVNHVHLVPPLHLEVLLLGAGFAIVGGILAGAVGGSRAARLRPVEALRDLG
jgi:ABC-type antimicrobial peptide transport system permease subunit